MYNKVNYTADIQYLNNVFIREYDISKANINILFTNDIIDKATYDYLYEAERMVRQKYIGMLQKDQNVAKVLKEGIIKAKKMLFEANDIKDYQVLSIKNDAVYVINRQLNITKFGLVKFVCKNVYTSYFRLKNLEIYYYFNSIYNEEKIDIKGIKDDKLILHNDYMLQVIKDVCYLVQISNPINAINMIKDIYLDYINLKLPIGYYREFNNVSEFRYKDGGLGVFIADNVLEPYKKMIDISYNISILMEIQKILISMIL